MRGLLRAGAITCALLLSARESGASPGSFIYVAVSSCAGSDNCTLTILVYDAVTSGLVTTIPSRPARTASALGIAISPDGSRVYLSVVFGASPGVVAIDATRHQLIPGPAAFAGELAVSRDGRTLFDAIGSGVYLYDIATNQQIALAPSAAGEFAPSAVAADPIRDRVYWTAQTACGGNMHAYDTTLGSDASLQVSAYPWGDAFVSRDGTRLYLTAQAVKCSTTKGGNVRIVDLATLATITDLHPPTSGSACICFPLGTVDAPARQRMYIWDSSAIGVVDRDTFLSAGPFVAVGGVTSMAVAADESRAYAATTPSTLAPSATNSLTVLNLASNAVASVIPLPGLPSKVVATPPSPASDVCSYRVDTHQSSWSINGGSAAVALTTNCTWVASSNASWAHISSQGGTGSATLTITVDSNSSASNRTATITIGGQLVNVTQASIVSTAPFGTIDTPADYATGLSGAIAVTGWALDDVGVKDVRIYRDPVAGEPPGQQVFIGYATFVDGARPDVQADYPSFPYASRAGWGLQLLTNMLPNQGTGTYRVYAFADDVEGQTTLLGFRAFTSNNLAATLPFGTIDTPGQGDTVSGTVVNFGWALSSSLIATDGSTIDVVVDGVVVGQFRTVKNRLPIPCVAPVLSRTTQAIVCTPLSSVVVSRM
jgi:hypothetical protein